MENNKNLKIDIDINYKNIDVREMIYKHKERYLNQDTIFWYDSDTGEYHSRKYKVGENALYHFGKNNYVKCKRHIRLPRY